ncbi:MAG: hypothetical protein K0S11_535 [Gammaproteobacteria bacterium]|jgi:hypothetical protein|nr:hypothetical protein [Gammaproteobacteria bacterium]
MNSLQGNVFDNAVIRKQRYDKVCRHPVLTGIDFIKLEPCAAVGQQTMACYKLYIYLMPKPTGWYKDKLSAASLGLQNVRILDAMSEVPLELTNAELAFPTTPDGNFFTLSLSLGQQAGGEYKLQLLNLTQMTLDPFFAEASFNVNPQQRFDIQFAAENTEAEPVKPEIDYLARDYSSFRKLMMDRLAMLLPDWQGEHPADMSSTLVELLANAADQLSYYQDAVATEAYLATARRRVSVKRHAKLIDYAMHEGCNARVWVHCQVQRDEFKLAKGQTLMTRMPNLPLAVTEALCRSNPSYAGSTPEFFETMQAVNLYQACNAMPIYTWGADEYYLAKGCCRMTLALTQAQASTASEYLKPGAALLLEAIAAEHGEAPNPLHRHVVMITQVIKVSDPLDNQAVLYQIQWSEKDALPFTLWVNKLVGKHSVNLAVARGNMVLADHGRSRQEPLQISAERPDRLALKHKDLSYASIVATSPSANASLVQDPRQALPSIELEENPSGQIWQVKADLLNSNRFSSHFRVELENNRQVLLQFGDGNLGKRPAALQQFTARYRLGNGTQGNIGANGLAHVFWEQSEDCPITLVYNPLPASGGTNPEPIEQVKLYAPAAFRKPLRCVTVADYVSMAEQHPEVKRAAAVRRWTGSWETIFIAVERRDNLATDAAFVDQLTAYLRQFQLLGQAIAIVPPTYIPLNINLPIVLKPGFLFSQVQAELSQYFSNKILADGRKGYFHSDYFGFGTPVYLSSLIAGALTVPGVAWLNQDAPEFCFQRWRQMTRQRKRYDGIYLGDLEIIQVNNQPERPEQGRIIFTESNKP